MFRCAGPVPSVGDAVAVDGAAQRLIRYGPFPLFFVYSYVIVFVLRVYDEVRFLIALVRVVPLHPVRHSSSIVRRPVRVVSSECSVSYGLLLLRPLIVCLSSHL
eukprot:3347174-Pyramimonas_sp.AAC.1